MYIVHGFHFIKKWSEIWKKSCVKVQSPFVRHFVLNYIEFLNFCSIFWFTAKGKFSWKDILMTAIHLLKLRQKIWFLINPGFRKYSGRSFYPSLSLSPSLFLSFSTLSLFLYLSLSLTHIPVLSSLLWYIALVRGQTIQLWAIVKRSYKKE